MAKKNSSKTATEKAIQSSEPRVLNYRGWKGVNFVDAPLTWKPLQSGPDRFRQTDLPVNYLMVQNNLETTDTLGLETRRDSRSIGDLPESGSIPTGRSGVSIALNKANAKLTGVSCVYYHWLFTVARVTESATSFREYIIYRDLLSSSTMDWTAITLSDPEVSGNGHPANYHIDEIGFYESNLLASTGSEANNAKGKLFVAGVAVVNNLAEIQVRSKDRNTTNALDTTAYIANPTTAPTVEKKGSGSMTMGNTFSTQNPIKVEVCYTIVNRMGTTIGSTVTTKYFSQGIETWSSSNYAMISGTVPSTAIGATGVDIYCRDTENQDFVFQGHVNATPGQSWQYSWLGNMTDISQWTNSPLNRPNENTTLGPEASHFNVHDSRLYYWGVKGKPYRLYIGGNPGSELSVARGLGGAYVDIEPGSGFEIKGTAKWKTTSGANIVTIMCGNRNTNKVKRFNLVETNITITNEISYKGYMYEEVSNVVGCNSRYGFGVFGDGLYSLSRYGLMITTMAMEYNSQMKNQSMSDVIQPLFTERLGSHLNDARLVCIDNVIYIAFSEDSTAGDPVNLDNVILCYNMDQQAWYTFTHDLTYGTEYQEDPDKIHQIFPVDSDQFEEGLGAITDYQVRLYPVTGQQAATVPGFQVLMETGELIPRMPKQATNWIEQFEFRFDYFIGPTEAGDNLSPSDPTWPTILVEGVDYYGRQFTIEKKLNLKSRGNHGLPGEQRDYVEWVRVGKLVESVRIRIKGRARFRLTHINCKLYQQADVIGTPYGYDSYDHYRNRRGGETQIHHYINDYNNLRRAVVT